LAVARQRQETRRGAPRVADLLGEDQASSTDCPRFAAPWLVCRPTGVAFMAVGTDQVHADQGHDAAEVGGIGHLWALLGTDALDGTESVRTVAPKFDAEFARVGKARSQRQAEHADPARD
jgi:hypothetical protein